MAYDPHSGAPDPTDIPNYLTQAIVVTLCCCPVTGIPAIVYGTHVSKCIAKGNFVGAREASQKARMWLIISVVGGMLLNVIMGGVAVKLMMPMLEQLQRLQLNELSE